MASLFRRLVRNRSDAGTGDEAARAERPVPETPPRPEPAATARDESATPDTPKPKKGGKGPRKTLDEVSSIGPGEPS